MKNQCLVAGFVFLCCFSPLKAYAAKFTSLYFFGDSLVDTGNTFTATQGAIPPSPPYFEGRFSNGEIWVDKLASKLGLESPTLFTNVLQGAIPVDGINYGFGGATTTEKNTISLTFDIPGLPGLQQQIQAFTNPLITNNQSADADALYILWAGANDYNPTNAPPDKFTPFTTTDTTISNLDNALAKLAQVGVKNLMLVNLPDLGNIPVARQLDTLIPGTTQRLNELTAKHNQELSGLVDKYKQDLNIISVDVNSLFKNAANLGFTNVSDPCLASLNPLIICDRPDLYTFWDIQHPTAAAHEKLADLAFKSIPKHGTVPEPGTVLGLLGLGAVGVLGAIKRKQKQSDSMGKSPLLAVRSSNIHK